MTDLDILEIDLTTSEIKRYSNPELFEKWIGGVGVGINLLNKIVPANADPLGPDNALIFSIGLLSTYYPIISKTAVLFRSPLTGDLGESYAGGRLSLAMRFSGLGAIIIKGQSEKSCYITITGDEIQIKKSGPLAYMYTTTIGQILREKIPVGSGRRSSIRIGPASENGVLYGNIIVDSFRHFGRLGAGTVMGAKGLKAIVITGDKDISLDNPPINRKEYLKTYKKIWNEAVNSSTMRKYHVLGTPENILPLNAINALPTKNFQKGKFEFAEEISGEKFVEEYLGRRISCNTCPVGCIHVAILRERYGSDSPADIHSIAVPYDFELLYALGSNLEIGNGIDVLKLIEQTERLGLDAITTGGVLGWLAEAYDKGIITSDDTKGHTIRFGNVQDFLTVIQLIAFRNNEEKDLFWYAGEGIHSLVAKYGGKDFSVLINSNPPAGYSTGPLTVLGHLIGGRHSHLDNAGYALDQKIFRTKLTPQEIIQELVIEEEWRNILNSLVLCLFARKVYPTSTILECFSNLGIEKSLDDLLTIGKEIQIARIQTKLKFGINYRDIFENLSPRFFQMPTAHGITPKNIFYDTYFPIFQNLITSRYSIKI